MSATTSESRICHHKRVRVSAGSRPGDSGLDGQHGFDQYDADISNIRIVPLPLGNQGDMELLHDESVIAEVRPPG